MELVIALIILFPCVVLHEYAHGWVAWRLGDSTAKKAGRLTLNPLKHIDPIGTVILPGIILFMRWMGLSSLPMLGWAKPVPVNFNSFSRPRIDMMMVAIAGPWVNFLLAVLASYGLRLIHTPFWQEVLSVSIYVNLLLAVFNLIPIPPLDGSRIVMGILPKQLAKSFMRLEEFGLMLVILFLYGFDGFDRWVVPVVTFLSEYLGVKG